MFELNSDFTFKNDTDGFTNWYVRPQSRNFGNLSGVSPTISVLHQNDSPTEALLITSTSSILSLL